MHAARASQPILFAIDVPLGLYRGYIGIMEKKIEATGKIGISYGYIRIINHILGLYWDTGKENGNY